MWMNRKGREEGTCGNFEENLEKEGKEGKQQDPGAGSMDCKVQ